MYIRTKISILLVFIIASILLVNCSISSTDMEDNTYLTPIPEGTLQAYRIGRPITSKLHAVIEATLEIHYSRLTYTHGEPKVILAEEMTLAEAKARMPKNTSEVYSHENQPSDTRVWLIVFEGQWQILPPVSNELLPLESGCIYVILDAKSEGYTKLRATTCISNP